MGLVVLAGVMGAAPSVRAQVPASAQQSIAPPAAKASYVREAQRHPRSPLGSLTAAFSGNMFEEIAGLAAVATFAAQIVWGSGIFLNRRTREYLDAKARLCSVVLGPIEEIPPGAKLKVLFIKHGSDAYLAELASNQERYEGRLRNRVSTVTPMLTGDIFKAHCRLRVHRRLGTQFKFFFEVGSMEEAKAIAGLGYFQEASIREQDTPIKVWVVLREYGTTQTVEGWTNNFWPAV